jgi:hypothetical protein
MDSVRDRRTAGKGFPAAISLAVVVGGLLGFQALLAPWGVALGLALTALGLWMTFTGRRSRRLS